MYKMPLIVKKPTLKLPPNPKWGCLGIFFRKYVWWVIDFRIFAIWVEQRSLSYGPWMEAILNFHLKFTWTKKNLYWLEESISSNLFELFSIVFSSWLFKNHILLNYIEKYYLKTCFSRNLEYLWKAPHSQKVEPKTHSQP